jgi:hypothetical protein
MTTINGLYQMSNTTPISNMQQIKIVNLCCISERLSEGGGTIIFSSLLVANGNFVTELSTSKKIAIDEEDSQYSTCLRVPP